MQIRWTKLSIPLLNDLIRPREQRRRDRQAEGLCRLEVDHQLELRRLLHWQVSGLGTFEDLVDIRGGTAKVLGHGRPVESEATRAHVFALRVHHRQMGSRGKVRDPYPLENEHGIREKQEGASALPGHCGEGALDVLRPSRLQDLQLQPQCARRTSRLVHEGLGGPVDRVPEHGDAAESRNDLLEQLQLLPGHLRSEESEASDVPTRVSEAGYEATRLGKCGYDDRYGLRSLSGGAGVEVIRRHDDVGFPSDELRGKGRDPLGSPLGGEVLDDEVLTLHVPELPQALGERAPDTRTLGVCERDIPQDPQPVDFARLLSLAGQRAGEKTCQDSGEERTTLHYSIT